MLPVSETTPFKLSQFQTHRLVPQRLYLLNGKTSVIDASLGRLFKLSVQSLHGYLAVKDAGMTSSLVTFAGVVSAQRNAQCRRLATLVRYIDSTSVDATEDASALRRVWKKAVLELKRDNLRRFVSCVIVAEHRLEYAFLTEADQMPSASMRDQLHGFAVDVCSVRDRLEELIAESCLEPT